MGSVLESLPQGSRVAILRLRSLGDCVLTTPAIEILKRSRPDLQIAVVVEDRFRAIFESNPAVATILSPELGPLRHFSPLLCLNLHGGTRSVWLTVFCGAPLRAGFGHFRHQFAYNVRIPRAQEILGVERPVHTVEHLASAMIFLGVPEGEIPGARLFESADGGDAKGPDSSFRRLWGKRFRLPTGSSIGRNAGGPNPRRSEHLDSSFRQLAGVAKRAEGQAEAPAPQLAGVAKRAEWNTEGGQKGSDHYAVIHPFAATAEKSWPRGNFLAVAQHLRESGIEPVFIGGPADDLSPFQAFRTIPNPPLAETKRILARASLFVGNDSGPAHMAAAFGLPAVVIFGTSDPAIWGPWRTASAAITSPNGISRVEASEVLDALARLRVPA